MGSIAKSIRNDLSKGKMIFSEETSRAICEMGGVVLIYRTETNIGDYSVSFLPEARTRWNEHVSVRRLASTQSRYDATNQSSFYSVEKLHTFVPQQSCQEGEKVDIIHGRQIMPKP